MSARVESSKRNSYASIFSGVIVSVAVTLVLILVFALLIRFLNISDNAIFPVNQVIKVISLFVGSIATLKKSKEKGFIKGLIIGLFYYILSYVVFSLLQGNFAVNINNLYDLLLTTLIGGIVGIISVNLVK